MRRGYGEDSAIIEKSSEPVCSADDKLDGDLAGEVSSYSVTDGQITERLLRELKPYHLSWKYGHKSTCEDCVKIPMMDLSDAVSRMITAPRPR